MTGHGSDQPQKSKEKHVVHWFRKGLRLHDNPSLREGLKNGRSFRCIFILDPWFAGASNVGINKWRFLLQSLEDLDQSLKKLNSRLFVIRGQPAGVLPKLFKANSGTAARAGTHVCNGSALSTYGAQFELGEAGFGNDDKFIRKFQEYFENVYNSEIILRTYEVLTHKVLRIVKSSCQTTQNNFRYFFNQRISTNDCRLLGPFGRKKTKLLLIVNEWGTTCVTFEEDPEPFGRVRDQNIMAMCQELGIEVIVRSSHTLYNLQKIIEMNGGNPPLTYRQFQNLLSKVDPPPPPQLPITLEYLGSGYTPFAEDTDDKYGVPTLEELGFDTDGLMPAVWKGGETEALARLERHLERKAWVATFGRPKMTPQSLLASQTGLSPYLRFGCLSVRLFYQQLSELYRKIKKAPPPLSLHGQVLWREFFYCAATNNPNFDKMRGNPICVQIPWDHNSEALAKWANGQTGFPWIDAIMTQLRQEGWIHHLARHAVACFLTRGDLWISWEEGMKVFDELLLDADWSVNAGTWMWLSCSSFFQQFFHCYCPVRFGRKADPNGDFIKKYLPVLKNFPVQYIHEPWNAPESVQRAAKCIIGKSYPLPMVNHAQASKINIERMKQVYQQLTQYRGPGLVSVADNATRERSTNRHKRPNSMIHND